MNHLRNKSKKEKAHTERRGLFKRESGLSCQTCRGPVGAVAVGEEKKYCSPRCRRQRHNKKA